MNTRERFLATMAFEPVDRVPLWEFDYWAETLVVWRKQGAPLEKTDQEDMVESAGYRFGTGAEEEFGAGGGFSYPFSTLLWHQLPIGQGVDVGFALDPIIARIPLNSFICPPFKYEILEEDGDIIITRDPRGHIRRDRKDGASISNILKTLVSDWEDWEEVKAERLALSMQGRLPSTWPNIRAEMEKREVPLAIGGHSGMAGFFDATRYLIGPEAVLYAVYDKPDLVKAIMNHLADLLVYLYDRVLSQIEVDLAFFTEDMGFKTGPLISPAMFEELMLPCYKRVIAVLHNHGIKNIIVDSDGNNWKLLPLFLEGGVTGMVPMEVAAGMHVAQLREAYPRLQMMGGIDKRSLMQDFRAIDAELERVVPTVLRKGGYIPTVDHGVGPDVPWENYVYFRKQLERMVYSGGAP